MLRSVLTLCFLLFFHSVCIAGAPESVQLPLKGDFAQDDSVKKARLDSVKHFTSMSFDAKSLGTLHQLLLDDTNAPLEFSIYRLIPRFENDNSLMKSPPCYWFVTPASPLSEDLMMLDLNKIDLSQTKGR